MGAGSKGGKLHYYSPGPRARRLFTYMAVLARGLAAYVGYVAPLDGVLARGWAACVGYVAPQGVAMWAI